MPRRKAKLDATPGTLSRFDDGNRDTIKFYRANEKPYGAFSNLFRRPVEFEGMVFPTAEHAYQAGKARKSAVRDWIQSAPSPALAAMAAHGLYTWEVAPDWSVTKFDRMREVLYSKFTQHHDLAELLLSTGTARLVEAGTVNNAVNRLWGEVNGNGQNMLGVMLMDLRQQLALKPSRRMRSSQHLVLRVTQVQGSQRKILNNEHVDDAV